MSKIYSNALYKSHFPNEKGVHWWNDPLDFPQAEKQQQQKQ